MQKNVLDYSANTAQKFLNKTAIIYENSSVSFKDLQNQAKSITFYGSVQ